MFFLSAECLLLCCIFPLHNQQEESGPWRSVWERQQIIWWNFTRFVKTLWSNCKYCTLCNILKPMAYMEMFFVVFQSCQSLEDHFTEGNSQPYLLATGTSEAQVSSFFFGQKSSSMSVMYILGLIRWAVQVPLCPTFAPTLMKTCQHSAK